MADRYTHYATGRSSDSIIELNALFAGPLHMVPDIEPDDSIASLDSVAITGAATVTATGLTVEADKQSVTYSVPALATTGTYTVTVTVTTAVGQTIITTGTMIVY